MLPEKTWKTDSVLRLFLGVFGTWSMGVLLAAALGKLFPDWSGAKSQLVNMVIVTLAFHGASLVWIHYFLRGEKMSWSEAFGFHSNSKRRVLTLAFVASICVLPVAWGLQQLSGLVLNSFHHAPELQQVIVELQKPDVTVAQQVFLGFLALVGAPIIEEMLFRGILYPTIKRAGYPKIALWSTSILFALIHQNVLAFLSLVFLAVILTMLYEETENLLAPIFAHSFFNAANFLMLLFLGKSSF
jgi:membrane protease YdiL (CAAX protease family)